ncbi:hypothetical protein D3C71_1130620 [compost metagenome]
MAGIEGGTQGGDFQGGDPGAQLRAGTGGGGVQRTLACGGLDALGDARLVGDNEARRQHGVVEPAQVDGAGEGRCAGAGDEQAEYGTAEDHGWFPGDSEITTPVMGVVRGDAEGVGSKIHAEADAGRAVVAAEGAADAH